MTEPHGSPTWGTDERADLGIIGGTGLYELPELTDRREVRIDTPFGPPSDAILLGTLAGVERSGIRLAFLPRHGRGHTILPSEVNSRANLWALKALRVRGVLAFSAVGSLRDTIRPLDVVVPDQIFDRTDGRPRTFFGRGLAAHVGMAHPFCDEIRQAMLAAAQQAGARAHDGGTYICIEGPQFSTRAESFLYRSWGFDVIGMTVVPEARLAREAELPYAVLALVSDFDVWHEGEADVSAQLVMQNLVRATETARAVIASAVPKLDLARLDADPSANSLRDALNTDLALVSDTLKAELEPLLRRYLR